MASTGSVRIVKEFTYRGATRTFSNRYHIGTAVPPDSAHWTTLCDAITAAEKAIYHAVVDGGAKIVSAIGYAPGSEVPVFSKTYALQGTYSTVGGAQTAGDVAQVVRYDTPDRSTKNHPVYCFNYYHAMTCTGGISGGDTLMPAQRTALSTYITSWMSGFSDGVTTFHRSRPSGDLVTGFTIPTYLTHRDLPR